MRRANLCVDAMSPDADGIGRKMYIGDDVILQITGETAPCARMDKVHQGLKVALTPGWRGGITCRVIHGGTVQLNDEIIY